MADEPKATHDTHDVPNVVLEELLAAFSTKEGEDIDFDDPAIDRMLGLREATGDTNVAAPTGEEPVVQEPPAREDQPVAKDPPASNEPLASQESPASQEPAGSATTET